MVRKETDKIRPQEPTKPAAKRKPAETFDDAMRKKTKEEWETAKLTPYKLTPALRAAITRAARQPKHKKDSSG